MIKEMMKANSESKLIYNLSLRNRIYFFVIKKIYRAYIDYYTVLQLSWLNILDQSNALIFYSILRIGKLSLADIELCRSC